MHKLKRLAILSLVIWPIQPAYPQTTTSSGTVCRISFPPGLSAPTIQLRDQFSSPINKEDNIGTDIVILRADPDKITDCSSSKVEYEVIEGGASFRGVQTDSTGFCSGAGCRFEIAKDAIFRRSYKWKARTFTQFYCVDLGGQCLKDNPDVSGYTEWSASRQYRNWGGWLTAFTKYATDYGNVAAISLGERSESTRAHVPDGILMSYGSKPARVGAGHEVEILASFTFDHSYIADAKFRLHTNSTENCERESVFVDMAGREVAIEKTKTQKGAVSRLEREFPVDIAGLVSPSLGLFNEKVDLQVRLRCRSARPFEYGVDFFAIDVRWMQ